MVLPGLAGTSSSNYIVGISQNAYEKRGFDIIAVNYRGMDGCPLQTPKLYNAETINDIIEPINYFH